MKKLFLIGGIIIALFAAMIVLTNVSNNAKLQKNTLYGDKDLTQATIDQLDDKYYQNIILPDALQAKIKSGKPVTVYFFSPTCTHCQSLTPKLMPIAKEMGIQIDQLNVLEFDEAWTDYTIEATPTLIFFKDGKEVNRIVGDAPEDAIKSFFNEVVLKP